MSWFSRSFSGAHTQDDDYDDGLTKSFARQLWSVLAPPPHTTPLQILPHKSLAAPVDPRLPLGPASASDYQTHSDLPADFVEAAEEPSSNEWVHWIDPASNAESPEGFRDAVSDLSNIHRGSEQGLRGVGKDLAELKGRVATGFSRILKVVREEIQRDQVSEVAGSHLEEKFQHAEDPESTANNRQLPGINFLRPPFGNILQEGRDANLNQEVSRDEEDVELIDTHVHQISFPIGVRTAITLPGTLGGGLHGISKFASSLFPSSLESDEEDSDVRQEIDQAVGITEEVLEFARNISMHPETWLDFPVFSDDEDKDEFVMSHAQKEHVSQVQLVLPRLAALRMELSPDYMNEDRFWKIYFVLLHSRLPKADAVLLSTPQIVEARALLLRKLQLREFEGCTNMLLENESDIKRKLQEEDKTNMPHSSSEKTAATSESFNIVSSKVATEVSSKDFHHVEGFSAGNKVRAKRYSEDSESAEEIKIKDILESPVKFSAPRYEEEEADVDKWLQEESSPHIHSGGGLRNDEDVSFSDLEEENESISKSAESSNSKYGWIQLNKNQSSQGAEGKISFSSNALIGDTGPQKGGISQVFSKHTLDQVSEQPERGESSDWSTVEDEDVANADFP